MSAKMNHSPKRKWVTEMLRRAARIFSPPVLGSLALSGCAATQTGTLEGTAFYRERIALPPDAVFEAELHDRSRTDQSGAVFGRATLEPAGQPPFHFQITYDQNAVQPGGRYAVRAAVRHRQRLLFTSDRVYPVFEGDDGPLTILLVSANGRRLPEGLDDLPASFERETPGEGNRARWHLDLLPEGRYQLRTVYLDRPESNRIDRLGRWRYDQDSGRLELHRGSEPSWYFRIEDDGSVLHPVDATGKPLGSGPEEPLQRLTEPALIEPRLAMTGLFIYLADSASITLCDDGRRLPVAMEADYPALEKQYLEARRQPGQELLVGLEGSIALRPSMEESLPPKPTLIVERFQGVWPRESCGQPLVDSPLRGTYWKLVRLNQAPVEAAEGQQEPHLIFSTEEARIAGSSGCNRMMGSFEIEGDSLQFGRMAGTMMACPSGMEQEQRFLKTLMKVERYRIQGSHLEMLDGEGAVLARFEAVALR